MRSRCCLMISAPVFAALAQGLHTPPAAADCVSQTLTVDSGAALVCRCFVPDEIVMTIHDVPPGLPGLPGPAGGTTTVAPTDLNQDCRINGLDIAIMLGAWTG